MRRVASLSALLCVLLAVTLLPLASSGPAHAQSGRVARYAQSAFETSNHQRVRHGRVRLHGQRCLQRAAARHAARMRNERRMFHQRLRPLLRRCHLQRVGENVAVGFRTGRAVVNRGWMRSRTHRENLLRRSYRTMAVAARRTPSGRWYVCQLLGRRA